VAWPGRGAQRRSVVDAGRVAAAGDGLRDFCKHPAAVRQPDPLGRRRRVPVSGRSSRKRLDRPGRHACWLSAVAAAARVPVRANAVPHRRAQARAPPGDDLMAWS
jgi:hypothetical protein